MTDFSKYNNISVKKDTYAKIDAIRKVIIEGDPEVSYSQVVTILVNKEYQRLNGKIKNGRLFSRTEFVDHKPSPETLMWKSVIALAASDATKSLKNRPTYTNWTDNDIDRARNWFTAPSQDFAFGLPFGRL